MWTYQLSPPPDDPVTARLLVCSVGWPISSIALIYPKYPTVNPWRYNSSNPTNNPGHFDLWVDIILSGKTNRISNWSAKPQIVSTP